MSYVDGFILPLPKANIEACRALATVAAQVWREHGALSYRECIAEDVKPGTLTSFPQSVNLEPDETVVFAWIEFASRAARDEINAKVMADPRITCTDMTTMPFDAKRMVYGGFETLVQF